MNEAVKTFLSVGRKFRHHRSKGPFLLIEKDYTLGEMLVRWIEGMGQHAAINTYVSNVTLDIHSKPKCIIIGLDGQDETASKLFLATVDRKHPEIVTVVYTSSSTLSFTLKALFPRLTVICKGNGLGEFLSELDSEVHVKEFVA